MAIQTVKTTYSLDVETIRASARSRGGAERSAPVHALDRLQQTLQLRSQEAERWARAVRGERTATSRRRSRA